MIGGEKMKDITSAVDGVAMASGGFAPFQALFTGSMGLIFSLVLAWVLSLRNRMP